MAIFGDIIEEAIKRYFFTKISIPINKKGYTGPLRVALTISPMHPKDSKSAT
jgi:hypothetical protein